MLLLTLACTFQCYTSQIMCQSENTVQILILGNVMSGIVGAGPLGEEGPTRRPVFCPPPAEMGGGPQIKFSSNFRHNYIDKRQ